MIYDNFWFLAVRPLIYEKFNVRLYRLWSMKDSDFWLNRLWSIKNCDFWLYRLWSMMISDFWLYGLWSIKIWMFGFTAFDLWKLWILAVLPVIYVKFGFLVSLLWTDENFQLRLYRLWSMQKIDLLQSPNSRLIF